MVKHKLGHVFSSLEKREYKVIGKISIEVAIDLALRVYEKIDSESFSVRDWQNFEGLIVLDYFRAVYKVNGEYLYIVLYG